MTTDEQRNAGHGTAVQTIQRLNEKLGFEPQLVVGAALYWAAIILQYLLPTESSSATMGFADTTIRYLVLVACLGICALAHQAFTSRRGRWILAGIVVIATLIVILLPSNSSTAVGSIRLVLHMASIAILMVTWGFAFASMDKRHAGQNVAATVLLTVFLVLIMLLISRAVSADLLTRLLLILSAFAVIGTDIRFINIRRPRTDQRQRSLISFVLSRVAFGAFMGFCLEAPQYLTSDMASPVLLVLGLVGLVAVVIAYFRSSDKLYSVLPALLFIAVGITYLPFFEGALQTVTGAAVGIIWLGWAVFSAFQLSDLKERCGMREFNLCLIEKVILTASIVLGILIFRLLETIMDGSLTAEIISYIAFAGIFAYLLATANTMAHLVSARQEDELRAELLRTRQERTEAVYDQITQEFGLSGREREVLSMLAEGYTRTYIRKALDISDGTAKAHIAHVYQKLNIHRKDDLLELIDARLEES